MDYIIFQSTIFILKKALDYSFFIYYSYFIGFILLDKINFMK